MQPTGGGGCDLLPGASPRKSSYIEASRRGLSRRHMNSSVLPRWQFTLPTLLRQDCIGRENGGGAHLLDLMVADEEGRLPERLYMLRQGWRSAAFQ